LGYPIRETIGAIRRSFSGSSKPLCGSVLSNTQTSFPIALRCLNFGLDESADTVLNYFDSYLETLEISPATRYDPQCLRREYIERTGLGIKLLHEVTPPDIRAVLKQAKDQGRRPIVFLQRLRSMYDLAIEDDIVEKNPARRVKNPKRRERAEIVPSFTEGEQARVLEAARGQDRNFIAVML